jgi:uncharacterized protein (TIRG00374 family)
MISSHVGTISSNAPPASRRGNIPWVALFVLCVVGYILYRAAAGTGGFDWARFSTTLKSLDPKFAALAILLIILTYFGRAIRWEVMIRPLGPTPSIWRLFVGTAIGFTAIVLLGRPGEFVRPWWIARESKTAFSAQLAVWFFERVYDLLVVILFFGFGLIHLASSGLISGAGPELRMVVSSGGTLALVGAGICLACIFALRFLNESQREGLIRLLDRLPGPLATRLRPLAANFLTGAAACCDPKLQWLVIFYTLVEWFIIAACYWALFQCFPVTKFLSIADIITIVGIVSFGAVVQLPGIGGGMQVAAIAVLTQLFKLSLEEATSLAIVLWVISFTLIVPLGVFLALREGLSFRSMRDLGQEAN